MTSSPMDMIETALDSGGDKDCECEDDKVSLAQRLALDDTTVRDSASLILAPGFALRPESEHSGTSPSTELLQTNGHKGTLAYRVVQFTPDGGVDSLPQGTVPGAVTSLLASPQANGSPAESPETRLALMTSGDVPNDGQFYVISDVLTTTSPRNLAPRASESVMNPRLSSTTREEKRRVTHNEVERRRRDKINTWIYRLAKIIPDCPEAHTKNSQSKGGILAKACDYISELRSHNDQLTERLKETQRREMDYELLKQEVEVLKNENAALKNENALVRAQLQQQGLLEDLPP